MSSGYYSPIGVKCKRREYRTKVDIIYNNTARFKNETRCLRKPLPTSGRTPPLGRARACARSQHPFGRTNPLWRITHTRRAATDIRVRGETANLVWSRSRARACLCVEFGPRFCFFPHISLSRPLPTPNHHRRVTHTHTHTIHARRVFPSYGFRIGFKVCVLRVRACVCVCVCV
uniref:Uncharacterized protein n=1 Tax=Schizaphis graminum TaxID=13262 RepID=A0A2S2PCA1_SCHGA